MRYTTLLVILISGCGVRGRPQPPLQPAEIGRGQPTFRRATQPLAFPQVPPVLSEPGDSEESAEKSGRHK